MRERPILFSDEMVRAILVSRKTQTRRVAKVHDAHIPGMISPNGSNCARSPEEHTAYCPYGQPGDRLWVRETFMPWRRSSVEYPDEFDVLDREGRNGLTLNQWIAEYGQSQVEVAYRADGDDEGWMPAIHMPRWASRVTLEVTGVRIERVQKISEYDAECEGVTPQQDSGRYKGTYQLLWDKINAKRGFGWDANPWVWVIEFQRSGDERRERG